MPGITWECTPRKRPKRIELGTAREHVSVDVRVISLCDEAHDEERVVLCVSEDAVPEKYHVRLRGIWSSTPLRVGSSLRLIGAAVLGQKELMLDWENGVVIVEGNRLVPCTVIAEGTSCRRKAVLSHYFKGRGSIKKETLIGTVVHQLFQHSAVARPEVAVGVEKEMEGLVDLWRNVLYPQHAQQLLLLNLSPEEVEDELSRYLKSIVRWTSTHMPPPKGQNECLQMGSKIAQIVDVEEAFWNSRYGFKGKIDCTLKIETGSGDQKLVPIELKTGKSNPNCEHLAQVMLYCLALASKQGTIESGLLLYLLDEVSQTVSPKTIDLKGILHMRNEIAASMSATSFDYLPEPLADTHICNWCSQSLACSLLQSSEPDVNETSFFKNQLKHLGQNHIEYFKRFTRWVLMEWKFVASNNSVGKGNISESRKLTPSTRVFAGSIRQQGSRTVVTFERKGVTDERPELFAKGDMLSVLSENNEIVTVASVISDNENFLDVIVSGSSGSLVGKSYLLVKHENSSIYKINLGNLLVLMTDNKQMSKIRSLIVDMRPPIFSKMKKDDILGISGIVGQLNGDQARAVVKSLMANDFAIIEGFPGSGKTSTLVALIRCLIYLDRTVLVTAHTHSAVDNVLSKLTEFIDSDKILRLGQQNSVKNSLQHLTLEAKLSKYTGAERVSRMQIILKETPIVACTCLGVSTNLLFSYRHFSMTLVDEASLVLEPTVIPAIAVSDSFLLVGDHRQLTPLVRSPQARKEGMARSLLERLTVHNTAVITLHFQYRMNKPIAELSSAIFYENKLQCANSVVAEAHISNLTFDPTIKSGYSEVYKLCVSNSLNSAVVFVDTQSYKNPSFRATFAKSGAEIANFGEAEFIGGLCKLFVELGIAECDLGVISVYRYHSERLRSMVRPNIEVNTVDQYQGRDKSVIMLSFVWTEEVENRQSELLADFRRINVAITRAKHKLILIGCLKSLSRFPAVNAVINAIPEQCITVLQEQGSKCS